MNIKIEHLFICVAVACVGFVSLRIVTHNRHKPVAHKYQTPIRYVAAIPPHKAPVIAAPIQYRPRLIAKHKPNQAPPTNRYKTAKAQAEAHHRPVYNNKQKRELMMAYYKKLQNLPGMELQRLKYLEKMEKGPFLDSELSGIAMYEVINSTPQPEYSARDNQRRRLATNLAYSMYLDYCDRFEACHQNAVTALVQTQDEGLRMEMFQELSDHYPAPWQQDILTQQLQRYGLNPSENQANAH